MITKAALQGKKEVDSVFWLTETKNENVLMIFQRCNATNVKNLYMSLTEIQRKQ